MEVIHTIGRRKESVARVYLFEKKSEKGEIIVNKKPFSEYFNTLVNRYKILQALALTNSLGKFDLKVTVAGGGATGQADAARLGIARALCKLDPEVKDILQTEDEDDEAANETPTYRKTLKKEGLLTRDSRVVERKKYGRKKARKKSQFSKR